MSPHETRIVFHEARATTLTADDALLAVREGRVSVVRLASFLGASAALTASISQGSGAWAVASGALAALFFGGVVVHARLAARRRELLLRISLQRAEQTRLRGQCAGLPVPAARTPEAHPYGYDIDLTGPDSLLQRMDATQTADGEQCLLAALAAPAPIALIHARQGAVAELSAKPLLREELAVRGGLHRPQHGKLSPAPFFALLEMPSVFAARPWLKPFMFASVAVTLAALVASQLDLIPTSLVFLCAFVQAAVLWKLREPVRHALDLVTARLGFAQAYEGMLALVEQEELASAHLATLRAKLAFRGEKPSVWMKKLARYEGFAQLRTQGPLYIVLNVLTLWDLFCLERIERFIADVGPHCREWFDTIAEIEVCASLATLHYADPSAVFPEVSEHAGPLSAEGLVHPLLAADARVANDVSLAGPGCAIVITGSNMAGKSTLLRALGLNVALALAGGPVCARRFVIPVVRIRASMRIDDSLQRGASYFHAELSRLRTVVNELDHGPTVLFLLDELLRGTNAHARHKGARAVLLHLLRHRAMGLVATHDIALSTLENELPDQVTNFHFTDVFEDGEMRFDYRLRAGVVKTSNALRLLAMAGVEVDVDDSLGATEG